MRFGRSNAGTAALLCVLAATSASAINLVIQPNKMYLNGPRGTSMDREITISALDGNDASLQFTMESFTLDADGLPLHKPSTLNQSITLSESKTVIRPGERFSLHVQI